MPQFAASLAVLYTESPFLDRFARAKQSGFKYVAYFFPYEHDIGALACALERNGLTRVLFNLPSGNWSAGDRGIAVFPDRVDEFRKGVATAIEVARTLEVQRLNCLVGMRDERLLIVPRCRRMALRGRRQGLLRGPYRFKTHSATFSTIVSTTPINMGTASRSSVIG